MTGAGQEELTLAGAAGTLWDASHARLQAALNEAPDGPHEWRVGGGTILAARWGHRTSFDIDVTVGPKTNLRELRTTPGGQMDALARELEGRIVEPERDPTARLRMRFAGHPVLRACALDIARLQPEPGGLERTATVNGVRTTVLDTAQILRGKLERAENSPVRDVFYMATAERTDAGSLAIAANCLTGQYARIIATIWKASNTRFAEDAQDYLGGVPADCRLDTEALGDQAAGAIEGALYTRVLVYAREGIGRIEATSRNGHVKVFEIGAGAFEQALESSGIEAYLYRNAPAAYAARETIRQGIEESGDQMRLVWSSGDWKPEAAGSGADMPPDQRRPTDGD